MIRIYFPWRSSIRLKTEICNIINVVFTDGTQIVMKTSRGAACDSKVAIMTILGIKTGQDITLATPQMCVVGMGIRR